jgi:DNA (cytosine-5)-methyltransferase 1
MLKIKKNKLFQNYTFIDLFAGIGGFRLALNSFGLKCVFTSEWDKSAQEVYKQNFFDLPEGDITKIPAASIPRHDILCGGFPCQAFSISGKQKGFEDTRGTLFFDIARIVEYHHPKILILENVKNFGSHDGGRTLTTVKNTLENLGYNIFFKVLNAGWYGVPQNRERIFIVGFKYNLKIKHFEFPKPLMTPCCVQDIALNDSLTDKYIIKRKDITLRKHVDIELGLFKQLPMRPIQIGIVNKGGQGERIYHHLGHSITLSAYGGGAGAKTGLYMINNKIRKLAPRECARLMGFPDSFEMHASQAQCYKQFGNGVVVNVVQSVVKQIIDTLVINEKI